jgi:hypothetical protein
MFFNKQDIMRILLILNPYLSKKTIILPNNIISNEDYLNLKSVLYKIKLIPNRIIFTIHIILFLFNPEGMIL